MLAEASGVGRWGRRRGAHGEGTGRGSPIDFGGKLSTATHTLAMCWGGCSVGGRRAGCGGSDAGREEERAHGRCT